MIFRFTDVNEKKYVFFAPVNVKFSSDLNTPADSLEVTLSVENDYPEFYTVEAENEGEVFFRGVVDEQNFSVTAAGLFLEISSRSYAALLLDNEAIPATYSMPSFNDIFEKHAKKYGFNCAFSNYRCNGLFTVGKGTSEWEVIERFAQSVMGTTPRVTENMTVTPDFKTGIRRHNISNTDPEALHYTEAVISVIRYGLTSEILSKLSNLDDYTLRCVNENTQGRKLSCRRLVNLAATPEWEKNRKIKRIIKKANDNSFVITVKLPYFENIFVGDTVLLNEAKIFNCGELTVKGVNYRLDNSGRTMTLKLGKKNQEE